MHCKLDEELVITTITGMLLKSLIKYEQNSTYKIEDLLYLHILHDRPFCLINKNVILFVQFLSESSCHFILFYKLSLFSFYMLRNYFFFPFPLDCFAAACSATGAD